MAKKKSSFLPKRIAGVKVPKKVRHGPFGELLASAAGPALVAAAVQTQAVGEGRTFERTWDPLPEASPAPVEPEAESHLATTP